MLSKSRQRLCKAETVKRTVIFTGPSVKAKYDEVLQKLNIGLGCHVAGGSLMLLSSSFMGASPLPAAVFGGLLWMQIMSTAKVTELGAWINLCKNVTQIERVEHEGDSSDLKPKEKLIITTDGSKVSIEIESRATVSAESADDDENALPSLKQLKTLGIIHVDENSLMDSGALCQDLFSRDDIVVTLNEGSKQTTQPPPGATNAVIPKLAEVYQKRQKAIHGQNKRLASMIANAPAMEPAKMLDRLGTASMAMGIAVFLLGGGMYLASTSEAAKAQQKAQMAKAMSQHDTQPAE